MTVVLSVFCSYKFTVSFSLGEHFVFDTIPLTRGVVICAPGELNRYSDSLRAGLSADRIPVGVRFSAPVQAGPYAHPASCTVVTASLSRG